MKTFLFVIVALCLSIAPMSYGQSPQPAAEKPSKAGDIFTPGEFSKAPTFIKSSTLEIRHTERVFTYLDKVEVTQNDLRMTCQKLVGTYNEQNQIQEMVATGDVVVTKGSDVRASGGRAVYKAGEDVVTITEAPELMQKGSVLIADRVVILLDQNRALAEGDVKVKVLQSSAPGSTDAKEIIKR